jgi:hypothetical protein
VDKVLILILFIIPIYAIANEELKVATKPVEYVAEEVPVEVKIEPQEVQIEVHIEWTKERIKQEVWASAEKYNTYPERMWNVMLCENTDLVIDLQSHWKYTATNAPAGFKQGDREQSFGLAQIHVPVHDTTYEQAIDPEYAIDFMAKSFANGKASWWTCYGMIYG